MAFKVVVHRTYGSPEIGILIHEGPKQLKVRPVFWGVLDWRIVLAREMDFPSQYGTVWPKGICEILDPILDGEKIAAVETLITQFMLLQEKQHAEIEAWRLSYRKAYGEIFPHRKED